MHPTNDNEREEQVDAEVAADASLGEGGADAELAKAKTGAVASRETDTDELIEPGEDEGQLAIDVYQTGDEVVVESPIAGVAADDIDIGITADAVTIRGKRERERKVRDEDYVYQECYWGRFSRSVVLPCEVDADKAQAAIKNGVLTVTIPKLNRTKAKKVKVKGE